MIDFDPHISIPQVSPREARKTMIQRWTYPRKPIIVVDSAFGGIHELEELELRGVGAVMALSIHQHHILEVSIREHGLLVHQLPTYFE